MFEFLKSKSSSRRERNGVAAFEECGKEEPFLETARANIARFACIHAGSIDPVVRYNATLSGVKSIKKP